MMMSAGHSSRCPQQGAHPSIHKIQQASKLAGRYGSTAVLSNVMAMVQLTTAFYEGSCADA